MQSEKAHRAGSDTISEIRDGERQFLLCPGDDDLFVRTGKQVIEHCRLGISVETWLKELHDLLAEVAQWCGERGAKVQACYAAPAARVTLFFVPTTESYDFELGAELAELNVRLVQTFNVDMIEMRQIPGDERDRFVHPETSRLIYGGIQ